MSSNKRVPTSRPAVPVSVKKWMDAVLAPHLDVMYGKLPGEKPLTSHAQAPRRPVTGGEKVKIHREKEKERSVLHAKTVELDEMKAKVERKGQRLDDRFDTNQKAWDDLGYWDQDSDSDNESGEEGQDGESGAKDHGDASWKPRYMAAAPKYATVLKHLQSEMKAKAERGSTIKELRKKLLAYEGA